MSRVALAVMVFAVLFVGQLAGLQSIGWDSSGGELVGRTGVPCESGPADA